jgi:4-hydroxy-tetrahydrodipicolinate synthase
MRPEGIWLPIVTPFKEDQVDLHAYEQMINTYIERGIHGIVPMGTTGEAPTLTWTESEAIIDATVKAVKGRVPIFVGLGGNNTKAVVEKLESIENKGVQGILSVSPYYNRPDQRGIFEHFKAISDSTDLDILVYNIPYRTGRTVENDTIRRLAELKSVVGLKDASGNFQQSTELLLNPPQDFSIMCGEDAFLYTSLLHGGQGGILASAHLETRAFLKVYQLIQSGAHREAFAIWQDLMQFIPSLFEEPNPAPLKYCLHQLGLISSEELRLPLMPITPKTVKKLNALLEAMRMRVAS